MKAGLGIDAGLISLVEERWVKNTSLVGKCGGVDIFRTTPRPTFIAFQQAGLTVLKRFLRLYRMIDALMPTLS